MQRDFPQLTLALDLKSQFSRVGSAMMPDISIWHNQSPEPFPAHPIPFERGNRLITTPRGFEGNLFPSTDFSADLLTDWRNFLRNSSTGHVVVFRFEPRSLLVDPAQPPTRFQRRRPGIWVTYLLSFNAQRTCGLQRQERKSAALHLLTENLGAVLHAEPVVPVVFAHDWDRCKCIWNFSPD